MPASSPIRLYSTLASSNRGEITVLAIAETILSVAIYVGIAVWLDTIRHIVLAAALAPFWLLRTKSSIRTGLNLYYKHLNSNLHFTKIFERLMRHELSPYLPPHNLAYFIFKATLQFIITYSVAVPLILFLFVTEIAVCWVIRFWSTLASFVFHPIIHLIAIRKNWRRLILATDFGAVPEWLPGVEQSKKFNARDCPISASAAVSMVITQPKEEGLIIRVFAFFNLGWFFLLIICVVPLLLRTAIKGVSILYTPLFLVINSDPINHKLDLGTRLLEMQHDRTAVLKRSYAFLSIALFLLTLLLSGLVMKLHVALGDDVTPVFILLLETYLPPNLKMWQVANAVNGALFLYLTWLYAPQAARRLERGVWTPAEVRTYLDRLIGLQMVLSVYSVMCAIAIFANFFLHHQFPKRHWEWFPSVGL